MKIVHRISFWFAFVLAGSLLYATLRALHVPLWLVLLMVIPPAAVIAWRGPQ